MQVDRSAKACSRLHSLADRWCLHHLGWSGHGYVWFLDGQLRLRDDGSIWIRRHDGLWLSGVRVWVRNDERAGLRFWSDWNTRPDFRHHRDHRCPHVEPQATGTLHVGHTDRDLLGAQHIRSNDGLRNWLNPRPHRRHIGDNMEASTPTQNLIEDPLDCRMPT
jgi:hypothetical protein